MHGQRPQWPQRRRPPGAGQGVPHRQNVSSGNAQRKYDHYLALAREAARNGDPVEAENCYQHAEHYFRMMRSDG
jgi:hypothetical protein